MQPTLNFHSQHAFIGCDIQEPTLVVMWKSDTAVSSLDEFNTMIDNAISSSTNPSAVGLEYLKSLKLLASYSTNWKTIVAQRSGELNLSFMDALLQTNLTIGDIRKSNETSRMIPYRELCDASSIMDRRDHASLAIALPKHMYIGGKQINIKNYYSGEYELRSGLRYEVPLSDVGDNLHLFPNIALVPKLPKMAVFVLPVDSPDAFAMSIAGINPVSAVRYLSNKEIAKVVGGDVKCIGSLPENDLHQLS